MSHQRGRQIWEGQTPHMWSNTIERFWSNTLLSEWRHEQCLLDRRLDLDFEQAVIARTSCSHDLVFFWLFGYCPSISPSLRPQPKSLCFSYVWFVAVPSLSRPDISYHAHQSESHTLFLSLESFLLHKFTKPGWNSDVASSDKSQPLLQQSRGY